MMSLMRHKNESRLLGEITPISDIQMIPPNGIKRRGMKDPPDEGFHKLA